MLICTADRLSCDETKKDAMGGASGNYGGQDIYTHTHTHTHRVLVGKSEVRRPPEELSVEGTITLKGK